MGQKWHNWGQLQTAIYEARNNLLTSDKGRVKKWGKSDIIGGNQRWQRHPFVLRRRLDIWPIIGFTSHNVLHWLSRNKIEYSRSHDDILVSINVVSKQPGSGRRRRRQGDPDVSLSHATLTLLVTSSITSHTLTLLSFDTVGKVGKYLTTLHPFSIFSSFFWYWSHKNRQFWKIGQKLFCYFPLWWHPMTSGMPFISLDMITHTNLGKLFITFAIEPIIN